MVKDIICMDGKIQKSLNKEYNLMETIWIRMMEMHLFSVTGEITRQKENNQQNYAHNKCTKGKQYIKKHMFHKFKIDT